jgi:hypothetical protein
MMYGAAGQAHIQKLAAHARAHTHGPVIARLSPNQTAFEITSAVFDARTGVIGIKGTVVGAAPTSSFYYPPNFYTGPTSVIVNVSVSQPISRRASVSGFSQTENLDSPVGRKVPFTVRLIADAGRFAGGTAVVTLSTYFHPTNSDIYVPYPSLTAEMVVRLSPHRHHTR